MGWGWGLVGCGGVGIEELKWGLVGACVWLGVGVGAGGWGGWLGVGALGGCG